MSTVKDEAGAGRFRPAAPGARPTVRDRNGPGPGPSIAAGREIRPEKGDGTAPDHDNVIGPRVWRRGRWTARRRPGVAPPMLTRLGGI
jgi:hypothetical protein